MPLNRFEGHCHFNWSNTRLLDAINELKPTVDYAIEIGLRGLAITDHGCVCGWIKANQLQQELDSKGIDFKIALGEEGYLVDKRENGIKYYHIIWIAKDAEGARQIRRLSSLGNLNSYYDRGMERVPVTKEEVEMVIGGNPGHIIVTSACMGGEVGTNILAMESARRIGDIQTAEAAKQNIINFVLWAKNLFGDDFYFETAPAASKEQIIVNKKIVELSQCFGVKITLGCDAHYLKSSDRYAHEAFLNSRGGERETESFYKYSYLQTEEEIKENLTPSIVDLYEQMCKTSMEIYNKIDKFNLDHPQKVPTVDVEYYPIKENEEVKNYPNLYNMYKSYEKMNRYWVNKCVDKLKEIGKFNDTYLSELEEEADVKRIVGDRLNTNMYSYPVALSRYVDLFWECGSSVGAGRGSACSALNHYLLGVTQLDPIEQNFPFFRYMNRDTDGLGDIDLDLCPSKLPTILRRIKDDRKSMFKEDLNLTQIEKDELGCVYVCTFGTETAKSAVQTACRGYRTEEFKDGIDSDTAQYLSSLIPSERGFVWSISDTYYGNKEKNRKPIIPFVNEVDTYPGLLEIMLGVEGLVSRKGRHASGVLFNDEDPYEFNAYMKTPSGEVVSQWDLHDAEWAGSVKFDFLVTEVQDKIVETINLLQESNEIEPELSLREAYDKYFHPDVLPLNEEKYWKVIQQAAVLDLFQLDSPIGRQGARQVKPENMIELSSTNALIRLMTTEKGAETWLDRYVRYKNNPNDLEYDINRYHLTEEERNVFNKYVGDTYGIGLSQEQFMKSVMDPDICGFSLKEANKGRKVISKKKMSEIPNLREQIFSKAKNERVAQYVWDWIVAPGLGYSFSDIHSVSYSYIGFQTAYAATRWNPIYWNCACLLVNSGSLEDNDKSSDYAKIAKALGKIQNEGINVSLVNINTSDYGFKPDVENNRILYGLKALSNINAETIEKIKAGRPYSGIKDFMMRCPLTKTAMINLIKAGAFDEVDKIFTTRKAVMTYYIMNVCDAKKKLTLQNFNGLVQHNLIPKELELQIRVYNFTKYLKANKKVGKYYAFDNVCVQFFEKFISDYVDDLEIINGTTCILQDKWDKIYKKYMDSARDWLKDNQDEVLKEYNILLFKEVWDKYASGTLSKWELDSLCFYYHEHELAEVNYEKYGFSNFFDIPINEIDYMWRRGGREIPIFKIRRIAGTVLAKDDNRSTLCLATREGIVDVKMSRDQYSNFKKQISEIQPDGTKKVLEKSWFSRANKLVLSGYRTSENEFRIKTYTNTESHSMYHIDEVVGGNLKIRHDRLTGSNTIEEEDYERL